MPRPMAEKLINAMKYGFWVRTKQDPPRMVRWVPQTHEDGRQSLRGRNWVEVLPHGERRVPERFNVADVELAGPHEWLAYYPAVHQPVCGWGRPRLPDGATVYCPRTREENNPFCNQHTAELTGSAGEEAPHDHAE